MLSGGAFRVATVEIQVIGAAVTPIGLKWAEDVPDPFQRAIFRALERFPANALETFRTHRRSTVGRVSIDGQSLVIKRYNAPNTYTRLRRMVGPSPPRKAWVNACILHRLGIATPRVLCVVTVGLQGRRRPGAYLVTEYLPAQPSDAFFGSADISVERKRIVASRLLEAIRQLHVHGFVHGDLKGKNILVREDVPYFIDLDTLGRRWLALNRSRGVSKDYARLHETIPLLHEYGESSVNLTS